MQERFCPKAIIRRACVALALVLLLPLLSVRLFTFIQRRAAPLPVRQVFPNLLPGFFFFFFFFFFESGGEVNF